MNEQEIKKLLEALELALKSETVTRITITLNPKPKSKQS